MYDSLILKKNAVFWFICIVFSGKAFLMHLGCISEKFEKFRMHFGRISDAFRKFRSRDMNAAM